jgi:2-methylcitrate dehydratase PrpD
VPWSSGPRPSPIATKTTVATKDGRVLQAEVADFKGTPDNPLDPAELREKVLMLTRDRDAAAMSVLFDRILSIEKERTLDWVSV